MSRGNVGMSGKSLPPVEVVDRSAVLDFIRSLGLTPAEVTKLTVTAHSVTVERLIPLGPLEVDITDDCPAVLADISTCTLCDGEGYTDDNEDETERAPWSSTTSHSAATRQASDYLSTFWLSLPPGPNVAVTLGLVHKVSCVRCSR